MCILSNHERIKLKSLLGKCLENGKLNSDKSDIFIEVAVRKGWDLCEDRAEDELQALEGRKRARIKREEEES